MAVQRYKGTRDLSPPEMARFRLIEKVFSESCLKWGYQEVRTPTIEYLHLFTSAGTLTPSMLSKVYSFLDWDGWSGERVVLRPDVTIPAARFYIENIKEELAKLFYVANVFIFEETGKKTREKWQCGVELIGAGSPLADVELIVLALEVLGKLELEGVELKLSHAGLIKGLLQRLGLSSEEQHRVFDQILDGDTEALARIRAERPEVERVLAPWLDLKGKSSGFIKNLESIFLQNLPELKPQMDNFIAIADLLQALNIEYQIDITSVRGFEYYTGVIFQLFAGEEKIGGGGRYNDLIPAMGGKNTPASGFALYVDRLMDLVKPEAPLEARAKRVVIVAEPAKTETLRESFSIATHLREAGFVAELYLGGKEPTEIPWRLDVRSKAPFLVLTDQIKGSKFEAQNIEEVLTLLKRRRASK